MQNNKVSPERWQELYGPVPQDFTMLVEKTLRKTREGPKMKRFTLRTALVLLICLLLLTGIALAAAGVFSTKNSLNMYTSAPADGTGVELQTDLHQTGGDFPDLTVKVRDAVYDGVTAFVTVEYKLKNPEKDMILSHWDTEGFAMKDVGRFPGYSTVPLTDPAKDPRRKLVIWDNGALVYGLYNLAMTDHIYESDGVLVLLWRIRMDSDRAFDVGYSWETNTGVYDSAKESYYHDTLSNVHHRIADSGPLELLLITQLQEWIDGEKGYKKNLYFCNAGITLNKGPAPVVRKMKMPVTENQMTITDTTFTFTKLATYMDIDSTYPMGIGTRPEDLGELGTGLSFEWLDDEGNTIARLGESLIGTYESGSTINGDVEKNRYVAFWPAVKAIPDTITLRAYSHYTDEYLATFTIPLVTTQDPSPTPTP